ncbi:MAG TPA: hypothetical protein VK169_21050 [Saprospiraceae bacterium]|nr:hypothetical protein [Saprospiraceae bacterium]
MHSILSLPAAILLAFRPLIYSLVPIYFAYVMTMALTFIFIVALPTKIAEITIKKPAITFILLTVTSIIMTTFGDKIVRKWHDFHDKEDKEIHYELSLKILDQKKSRYLIFVVYFILLLIFNIASLNDKPMFDDDRITTAILQSFATFIAYDRLLTNWSSIKSKS